MVLINDNLHRARWVFVRAPARPPRPVQLERLLAPSAYARSGITLGGQSFGRRTLTGALAGSAQVSLLQPRGRGYLVRVPAASAALLTLTA